MANENKYNDRIYVPLIWVASVAVPILVGILLKPGFLPRLELGFDPLILPKINAGINTIVSVLLIAGFIFIKNKRIRQHRAMMILAFSLSAVFLVLYVLYHLAIGHTPYCEEGPVSKPIYLFVLLTHILLSVSIIPLASFSIYRALSERFDRHKRLARVTFPLWLYVSVTGVLVYLLISPCY